MKNPYWIHKEASTIYCGFCGTTGDPTRAPTAFDMQKRLDEFLEKHRRCKDPLRELLKLMQLRPKAVPGELARRLKDVHGKALEFMTRWRKMSPKERRLATQGKKK